jgi:PAS domain S-box-containing protein
MRTRSAEHNREPRAVRLDRLEQDNLELRRRLENIEEARAVLSDLYDYAPIGFVTLDDKGCIVRMNLTIARMLGRERSGLLGQPFFTQVANPYYPVFLKHLSKCRERRGEVVSDMALRVGRSAVLPVELRSVPVPDFRGSGTNWRTAITDITARLQAGRALRESEERYRELVELSPDGIFILHEGTIVFANSAARLLFGVENEAALIGGEFMAWVRLPFCHVVRAALDLRNIAAPPIVEAQLTCANGGKVDIELVVRPFRHDGEPALLVVARDITRRRKAERQVLVISERERSTFGRDMHDGLCQSLMGIAFMADTLRKQVVETNPKAGVQASDITRIARQCCEEARNLARGLCPVTMEKSGLVAALHELTVDITKRTRVGCVLECDDTLTVADAGVATNLYRIAQEAVANAIKHGKAKSILIQFAAENGRMTLYVRDDGKGIPAKPKSSGMGLHTMQYRATMIGGSLAVQRDLPRGTVVTCSFPVNGKTS